MKLFRNERIRLRELHLSGMEGEIIELILLSLSFSSLASHFPSKMYLWHKNSTITPI